MSINSEELSAVRHWLKGSDHIGKQLPDKVLASIQTLLADCRHRRLVSSSVASAYDMSEVNEASSVTLTVSQRCARILRQLLLSYLDVDSVHHQYLEVAQHLRRNDRDGVEHDPSTLAVVYLLMLVDATGARLARATTFSAITSNVTMRFTAIIKSALQDPEVLLKVPEPAPSTPHARVGLSLRSLPRGNPCDSDDDGGATPNHHTLVRVETARMDLTDLSAHGEEEESPEPSNPVFDATFASVSHRTKNRPISFTKFVDACTAHVDAFIDSLTNITDSLCVRAAHHVYDNETVLTVGCSFSTLQFFVAAARTRTFKLVVLEGAPPSSARKLAAAIHAVNEHVSVQVLPDSSTFAVMSSMSKVFVGCESVLATGGIISPVGTHPVCAAAKLFSVPVIVVAMTVKFSPWMPIDPQCSSLIRISKQKNQEIFCSSYGFPGDVLTAAQQSSGAAFGSSLIFESERSALPVEVTNSTTEYVPPRFIALFVTNDEEYTVPRIHRSIQEFYGMDDDQY